MADERHTFSLSLTTPDGAVFDDEAEMVIVPGAAGEIGVLARHAPLIALLQAGSTRVYTNRDAQEVQEFATGPGFFTVEQDRALALVDTAVNVREIDPALAEEQLEDIPVRRQPVGGARQQEAPVRERRAQTGCEPTLGEGERAGQPRVERQVRVGPVPHGD